MWPFNTGDCLIEVTTWAGFTVVHKAIQRQNRGHDVSFEPNSNSQNNISSSVWMRKKTFQQGVGIFRKTFWNISKRKNKEYYTVGTIAKSNIKVRRQFKKSLTW